MKDGDISNEVVPRLLVVWEGLIALPPKEKGGMATWFRARQSGKRRATINSFDLNEVMAAHIWDITWRHRFSVDVVTFLGDEYVDHIERWCDDNDLPIGNVTATTPEKLARKLAYMPSVFAVYDPEPERRYTYGGKGRLMDPEAPNFFGVK